MKNRVLSLTLIIHRILISKETHGGFLGKTYNTRVSEQIPAWFRQSVPVTVHIEKITGYLWPSADPCKSIGDSRN